MGYELDLDEVWERQEEEWGAVDNRQGLPDSGGLDCAACHAAWLVSGPAMGRLREPVDATPRGDGIPMARSSETERPEGTTAGSTAVGYVRLETGCRATTETKR